MINDGSTIPWNDKDVWSQVVLSITRAVAVLGADAAEIRELSRQIVQAYTDTQPVFEMLCRKSCPTCTDVCCKRATVWYDLKDLLCIYMNSGSFPASQICRKPDHSCCNLTPSGCRLNRYERPFVCTWYICPAQKSVLKRLPEDNEEKSVFHAVKKIQMIRKDLEEVYIKAVCG